MKAVCTSKICMYSKDGSCWRSAEYRAILEGNRPNITIYNLFEGKGTPSMGCKQFLPNETSK